ncbi:MAG: hypothetical protein QG649_678 [Patescibacteria group bacterium]|jgi:hypothetical protein|nr:hypothetical protein [Patescibacteria group bacterium]
MDPYQQPQNQPTDPIESTPSPVGPEPSAEPTTPTQEVSPEPQATNPDSYSQSSQAQPDTSFTEPAAYAPAPVAPAGVGAPAEDPGKTMGIVGIILVFFFAPAAIVLGMLSRNKSKAAGHSTTLGTVSLIGGIVMTVLGIISTIAFFALVSAGLNSISTSGSISTENDTTVVGGTDTSLSLDEKAKKVKELAEAYKTKAGDYPQSKSEFSKYPESTIPTDVMVFSAIRSSTAVTYSYCGPNSAQVSYLGDSKEDIRILPVGTASATEPCKE